VTPTSWRLSPFFYQKKKLTTVPSPSLMFVFLVAQKAGTDKGKQKGGDVVPPPLARHSQRLQGREPEFALVDLPNTSKAHAANVGEGRELTPANIENGEDQGSTDPSVPAKDAEKGEEGDHGQEREPSPAKQEPAAAAHERSSQPPDTSPAVDVVAEQSHGEVAGQLSAEEKPPEAALVQEEEARGVSFVFDKDRLEKTREKVLQVTENNNLDMLLFVHSKLCGLIWKHQSNPNKDALLDDMDRFLGQLGAPTV